MDHPFADAAVQRNQNGILERATTGTDLQQRRSAQPDLSKPIVAPVHDQHSPVCSRYGSTDIDTEPGGTDRPFGPPQHCRHLPVLGAIRIELHEVIWTL